MIYPPGYVPYPRERIAPLTASGQGLGILLRSILVEQDPIYRQHETVSTYLPVAFGLEPAMVAHMRDDPTMPIVGEGEAEPNDTYGEQLVASARAAVEEVAERGRIAIGGHSYGAFMAANLLAHSDLCAASIARSGAYNRTLTPFGFQAEERTLWEAPEVYFGMSPFMHAEKVDEPLLPIHGDSDNNAGTYPIQSEHLYHALKGHGTTARLVMLPHESHGYRGRESVLHMLWEDRWLEHHVREAEPTIAAPPEAPARVRFQGGSRRAMIRCPCRGPEASAA